ncbi:MAG: hypothetical protein ABJC36_02955 [Gemmatimonadales bacterium]
MRAPALAVWAGWLALLAAALLFVHAYGNNVPSWDDWDMVPVLTRAQPVSLGWLWSQHNEHRVPLPRLLFLGLNRLTTVDFRVTMYADVLAMALLAAGFVWTVGSLRGRLSLADLFLPIVLLELGQAANLLWGWQLEFFASAGLAGIALMAIAGSGTTLTLRRAAIVTGGCALALPLTGANGLGMVPALALWPLALVLLPARWTGAPALRGDRVLLGLGAGALLLTAIYFIGWERVPYHPRSAGIYQTLKTSAQFVTIGLGPATRVAWPLPGITVLAFFAATLATLARAWRDRPGERARAGGLILFLGAMASLALGLGMGRNGFEVRYVTLAVPAWCAGYLAWALYGGPDTRRWVPRGLAAVALVTLWWNVAIGLEYGRDLHDHLAAFERDLVAGVPRRDLVRRYDPWLHPHQDVPIEYLPMLRAAGIGVYRDLRDDPPARTVALDLTPSAVGGATWHDSTMTTSADEAWVDFTLPADRYVTGLRLRYEFTSRSGVLSFVGLRWQRRGQVDYSDGNYKKFSPTGDRANWERGTWTRLADSTTTVTVVLADTIGRIRVLSNYDPGILRIRELVLLEPER